MFCIVYLLMIFLYSWTLSFVALILYIGAMIFVFQSVGTSSFILILPFLQSSMRVLSMPGDLLLFIDCIASSMSNISHSSFSSSCSVSISFVWVLSRKVLRSAVAVFRRSESRFSACSLYLLHYIRSHHLCLYKDLYEV